MDEHKPKWFEEHEKKDMDAFALRPTKEEMKQIVHDALVEFFSSYGRFGYRAVIVAATLVVAIGVLTGGFSKILALFGLAISKS